MWLLAEAAEPITLAGGAGWVGTGLLGAVLWWLLYSHLPALAKERKETSESRDKIIQGIVDKHAQSMDSAQDKFIAAMAEARKEFRDWLQLIATNDEVRTKALTDAISRELVILQKAVSEKHK